MRRQIAPEKTFSGFRSSRIMTEKPLPCFSDLHFFLVLRAFLICFICFISFHHHFRGLLPPCYACSAMLPLSYACSDFAESSCNKIQAKRAVLAKTFYGIFSSFIKISIPVPKNFQDVPCTTFLQKNMKSFSSTVLKSAVPDYYLFPAGAPGRAALLQNRSPENAGAPQKEPAP